MLVPTCLARSALIFLALGAISGAAGAQEPSLERRFDDVVRPFLRDHCLGCHGSEKPKGKLDLSVYSSVATVVKDHRVWAVVVDRLEAEEMPPEEAKRQPAPAQRRAVVEWIGALRDREAKRNAGDPGRVLPRRLSNAELDYTIHDLTGVDIRPTREFPVDPANTAGFDNSGESLAMSPALLKKYLAAARLVASHLIFKPDGFEFAPEPAITETDRDKYCVRRIIDFYKRHQVDYADYFHAAWRFDHRAALGKPAASLHDFAAEAGLSSKYLATVREVLEQTWPESGPLGQLQALWKALPWDAKRAAKARRDCERMRNLVNGLRDPLRAPDQRNAHPGYL